MENPKQRENRIKRNQEIAKLYPDCTLQEIANRYGLTPEGVRYILKSVQGSGALTSKKVEITNK